MDFSTVLIDGEFRGLLRNVLAHLIGKNVSTKKDPQLQAVNKFATWVVASLVAVFIFDKLSKTPVVKKYISHLSIVLFVALNFLS
jgi:hypothetical protein